MIREAELQKDKDNELMELVQKKNQIDVLLHQLKQKGKDITNFENRLKDVGNMKDAQALENEVVSQLSESASNNTNTTNESSDSEVVDAEIKEKK